MDFVNQKSDVHKSISKTGLSLVTITVTSKELFELIGGVALALTIGCAPFVAPALRRVCLPYVPATDAQVNNIMKMLSKRKGKVLDIGSGDGRVVIAAAKEGFIADGVELNPWLVLYSKWGAFRNGVYRMTHFYYRDMWKFDMSVYNNVVIFGVEEMMPEIEAKLSRELPADAAVIACRFPLPSKTPVCTCGTGIDTVWLYSKLSSS